MNPVVEVILSRRSVREGFSSEPVPDGVLQDIVRCGLAAPSSKNARPWRFHVVTDRRLLQELAEVIAHADEADTYVPWDPVTGKPRPEWSSTVVESALVLRSVPVAIFIENLGVFSRGREALLSATPEALAGSMVGYSFEVMGIGAALQSMWIAAVAYGLGGVFMGDVVIAERTIQQRLGIECDLLGVLALGYSVTAPVHGAQLSITLGPDRVRWFPSE